MELKKNMMQCFQQVIDHTLIQEETLEAIVPDACPDILRIVSVCGQICISKKQVIEDHIIVTGQVDTAILYLPEEGDTLCKMTVRIPFTNESSALPLESGDEIFVIPTLSKQEARILNPRKVLVRLELMLELSGFQKNIMALCCGIEEAGQYGIEERMVQQEIHPLCHVQSKHFTFDESFRLEEELQEILSVRIAPHCQESKIIGNKLIFKGETEVQIMYLSEQNQINLARHQLPFSQIMEMEDFGEDGQGKVTLILESFYMNPASGRGDDLEITLDIVAQATVRNKKYLTLLEDAYSVTHHLSVEKENNTLVTVAEEFIAPQPIRQIFETTIPISSVEDSCVRTGKIIQNREGTQLNFSCDLTISLLCRDESGAWNTLEFKQEISHSTECNTEIVSCCRCFTIGDIFSNPAPGGIELRFSPQFQYSLVETKNISAVASATLGEPRERGSSTIVLRLPQAQEELWDIAKQYGTTTTQITQANQLQEENLSTGRMLLIPSIR